MFDTILKSRRVITGGGLREAWVVVKDGIIAEIRHRQPHRPEQEIVDLGWLVLMPGVVDPHVHINEPGRTDWEGFETGTRAARAGGITTLVDMPLNSSPVTTTVAAFEQKLACAREHAQVHTGFWGGIVPGNEAEIEPLIRAGIWGFKAFLTHSGIDEFPNVTESDLRKVMPILAKWNMPLLVHGELTDHPAAPFNANPSSYQNYLTSRPHEWEDRAVELMIRLCEEYRCRVHIVHLSSAHSIEPIRAAKERGLPLTVETAQHYLYFNAEAIADGQTQFKCAPPIRERANNELLWKALRDGIIDFVATDHSPAPPAMKALETGNFMQAWGGIASLQFALPALWTAARARNISLPQIATWLCEKPAALTPRSSRIGKIEKGYNADLVAWDPEASFVVTPGIILHRHKLTPYMGERLYGVVERVWLSAR